MILISLLGKYTWIKYKTLYLSTNIVYDKNIKLMSLNASTIEFNHHYFI